MSKFRSKLKRHAKGAKWSHGQSATSNPQNKKHRLAARSRFFQPNLHTDAKPSTTNGITSLTLEAISKHDARQSYAGNDNKAAQSIASTKSEPTVNDIAMSMRSVTMSDASDDDEQSYAKTYQTFGSRYSSCTNMTFNKFLNRFQQTSELHKEMLAILSAVTDVIKERNGTQSSTEFFLGLMETLEATKEENEIIATLSLLTMVIKSVAQPVLRKKFIDTGEIFLQLVEQFADSENQNVLRSIIGCISVLLRAQEYASWSASLTLKLFNQVLSYVTHTKPNIRKAAQRAIESIIHGSCFMIAASNATNQTNEQQHALGTTVQPTFHPAGSYVAKFCIEQFKVDNLTKSQTLILYTIELTKRTLNGLKNADIKEICEYLLSIMATSKTTVSTNCFEVLDHLFRSKSPNLSIDLIGKLLAATYDYRPDQSDITLTLAWMNVMRRGHVCLAAFNITKCLLEMPRFVSICAGDIWKSENLQVASGVYHILKELFDECVAAGLNTETHINLHRKPVVRMINDIAKCLNEPYGFVSEQVVSVFETIFEVCGHHFRDVLQSALNQIAARHDNKMNSATKQIQIENAVRAAISTMGPDAALIAVPLTDANGDANIERLWVLQALKKSIKGSSFEYFYCTILPLASKFGQQWKDHQSEGNLAAARTNELFYIQSWDLFPSFCEQPKDLNKFGSIAKLLGDNLKNCVEIRVAIYDGLLKLLENANDDAKVQLARFARNYLNILLNIYTKKPKGTEEHISHSAAMKVIVEYLKITPNDVLAEIYSSVRGQYKAKERVENVLQRVQELNKTIKRTDNDANAMQIGVNEAKKIQDSYELLRNIIEENTMGVEYVDGNTDELCELLQIIPVKRLQQLFDGTQKMFGTFAYQAYFELLMVLAVYQSEEHLNELFTEYIEPTLRNAKNGGITPSIKERQSKSYQLLQNILESERDGCKKFVSTNLHQIQKALSNSQQNRKDSSQDARLTCLYLLIERVESRLQYNNKLISQIIFEVVLSFDRHGKNEKDHITVKLLKKLADFYKNVRKMDKFVNVVMLGLDNEADDTVVSSTIQTLRATLQHLSDDLPLTSLDAILEQVLAQQITGSRQKVKAATEFLMVFTKVLPASYVANHLPEIVKAMSAMKPDTKRFFRRQLGFIYKRLCKRFTPEEIVKLVPGNDEITHKKLKNIRKALSRAKRQKAVENDHENDSDDDGLGIDNEKNSDEDILADSDDDDDEEKDDDDDGLQEDILMDSSGQPAERPKKKKVHRKDEKYIHEDADTIVDLADIKAMSKISSSRPVKNIAGASTVAIKKSQDPNRGFKTDISGKLIIEEPKRSKKNNDSDSDDDNSDADGMDKKQTKKPESNASDSDDEVMENAKMKSRKRKATSALSQVSDKTGATSKYVAGGKGIHRPVTGASSVRSGYTNGTKKSTDYGSEYRSKKSKGDIKTKGGLDPYAYIPLSRNTLNKRKRAKNSGQFKSIVQAARKGAAAGSKRRRL